MTKQTIAQNQKVVPSEKVYKLVIPPKQAMMLSRILDKISGVLTEEEEELAVAWSQTFECYARQIIVPFYLDGETMEKYLKDIQV